MPHVALVILAFFDSADTASSAAAAGAFAAFAAVYVIIAIAVLILSLIINWKIASKAGYQGALSLLMLIPLVNIVIVLLFAFSEWPIEAEVKRLRGGSGAAMPLTR